MHTVGRRSCLSASLAVFVLTTSSATAATLHIGLPSGRSVAYTRTSVGGTWARSSAADLPDVGANAMPTLADLDGDGDGDQDVLIGEANGGVHAYQNTGSDRAPMWTARPEWDPPVNFGHYPAPALGDVDGDGDSDLLVGSGGDVRAFENVGSRTAPTWRERSGWKLTRVGNDPRPALADIDGDGRMDVLVGLHSGAVMAFTGSGNTAGPLVRRATWDGPLVGTRVALALGDLDGDRRPDLIVTDGNAASVAFRNTGSGWAASAAWNPPDPGSGPGVPALIAASASTSGSGAPPPRTNTAPVARLTASPASGAAPLSVTFDASGSQDADGDTLSFTWDFGDGSAPQGQPPVDPISVMRNAAADYESARAARDAGDYIQALASYLDDVDALVPLTTVQTSGPVTAQGTSQIDRVARWYLQKIGHDLGGMYYNHALGLSKCEQYATSLQYSRESAAQATLGNFPSLPALNGTDENIAAATQALRDAGCGVPAPVAMFPVDPPTPGSRVTHVYRGAGRYTAKVTVSDAARRATATATSVVGSESPPPDGPPPVPPPGGDVDNGALQGFGAATSGGQGGPVIHVAAATDGAVRAAFEAARTGGAIVVFDVAGPIVVTSPLPALGGAFITIEGNGVTLIGNGIPIAAPLLEVTGHDVIVRNLRARNGGDNLRAQGDGAYNIVFSHVSSTGSADDGISIAYGAHDVTVQWSFLAGNTRSLFLKYRATTRISIHHTWVMKQWIRGPLVSSGILADIRNVIVEDWTMWGARFEADSSGNVVSSLFDLGPYANGIGGKANGALRLIQSGPVFTAGNVYGGVAEDGAIGTATAPLDAPPVTTLSLAEMEPLVRGRAGCLPRDAVDQRYIDTQDGWRVGKEQPLRLVSP